MPVPPRSVRAIARRALEDRKRYGRGGTDVGVARARDLARGANIPETTLRRMVSFFARHGAADSSSKDKLRDQTSAASIAFRLWGGRAGEAWAKSALRRIERAKAG